MPATRTGRQSSPAKGLLPSAGDDASPSKSRVQPMRSARLRSASPFADMLTADSTSSGPSQASASKRARTSPSKRASTTSAPGRSTRSRSRSVLSDGLSAIDETEQVASSPSPSSIAESKADTTFTQASDSVVIPATSSQKPQNQLTQASGSPGSEEYVSRLDEADQSKSLTVAAEDLSSTSSEESSESDSDSSSESDTDSDMDDDDAEVPEDLDALLRASEQAYKDRALSSGIARQDTFEDNQDVLLFDTPKKNQPDTIPLKNREQKDTTRSTSRPGPQNKVDKQIEALASGSLTSQSAKKSKHARTLETSAGSNWFNMPEFGASSSKLKTLKGHSAAEAGHSKATGGDARLKTAEQLRQEVQAIRLRNALDPKRFYRASAKNQAMPKFAQLGKIIASPLEPKAVMSRKERGRTVVEELIRDAEAASYAKRKFSESQIKHRPSQSHHKSSKPPFKKRK